MNVLVAAALLLAPATSPLAQEPGTPKEVSSLAWMVGKWSATGNISFGGHQTPITSTMVVSFDGQFLKVVSADKSSDFTLTKTSMTGWDAAGGQYTSYTFTNIAPVPRIEHGKPDLVKLTLTSDPWEAEGMKLISRETISKISDTKLGLVVEAKMNGKWDKEMDLVLTKD